MPSGCDCWKDMMAVKHDQCSRIQKLTFMSASLYFKLRSSMFLPEFDYLTAVNKNMDSEIQNAPLLSRSSRSTLCMNGCDIYVMHGMHFMFL